MKSLLWSLGTALLMVILTLALIAFTGIVADRGI
jgi:hypothetical protein